MLFSFVVVSFFSVVNHVGPPTSVVVLTGAQYGRASVLSRTSGVGTTTSGNTGNTIQECRSAMHYVLCLLPLRVPHLRQQ